jgi:class 3 adenylate cyclase/tetratricopeptide (TPR) repeat protein
LDAIMDVAAWLRSLGLERYEAAFRDNEIDGTVLPSLTAEDLKDLGVAIVGHRRKLLDAIAALRADVSGKPPPADPVPATDRTAKDAAERRQVTVMFSDLVGSTALAARMDPEDLREIISAYQKCVAETVQRYDGFVARYMGDGVLVHFGYPQAHEDDAERAVRAGLELVTAIAALKSPVPLQSRIGIATGIVVVGELIGSGDAQERTIVGKTPNLAARLQVIAEANTVVICDGTRRLLGNLFELEDLGLTDLKGITDPTRAWAALRASSAEGRFEAMHASDLTVLIGRQEESELLRRRWSKAKAGEGQVVLLSGEAGIGKSRLTAALLESVAGEPHRRLRYFCSPQHGDSAFYPIIGQLERAAGLARDDTPQARLDKLSKLLAQHATPPQDAALLVELLSLPNDGRYGVVDLAPQQRRQRTLDALILQLQAMARQNPVLMIFEDAHWADPTSLEVISHTVNRIATLPVLLIVTFRTEFDPPWIGRPHVAALTINRLAEREVAAMVDCLVGNKFVPANIRQDIIERSDGIPLFVEEMTKAVLEAESEHAAKHAVAAVPLPALAVPASLHASLMARLDRLGAAKEVAQIGAAIGREFSHALLAAVVDQSEAQLRSALDGLIVAGLLFRQGVPPHASYLFKHALVQDTAYGTLLREQRRALHARIADSLESEFADIAEHQPELLARHCTEAGLSSKAIDYWCRAGRLAAARSANREAVSSFEQALQLLEALPQTRERQEQAIDLRFDLRNALFALGEFERILGILREAETLAKALEDQRRLAQLSVYLCHNHYMAGNASEAVAFGQSAVALAESVGDISLQVTGNLYFGTSCLHTGDYRRAEDLLLKVLQWLEGDRRREKFGLPGFPAVVALGYLAWLLADRGKFEQGIARAKEGIALAESLDHPHSRAWALWTLARVHIIRGDPGEAVGLLERGLALSREWSLVLFVLQHTGALGYAYALSGRAADGIPLLEEARTAIDTMEFGTPQSIFLWDLGETYAAAGRLEDALEVAERLLTLARGRGQRRYEAWTTRLVGDITARRGPAGHADRHYRDALALAEELGMPPLIARCHLGLGRLSRLTNKRSDAEGHLTTAAKMCREMDMRFWLEQAEAELRQLN